jgi:PASTA domain
MEAWEDGRRAWERLAGWDEDGPAAGHPDDGDGALAALSDIGLVRRLLDQAELVSVRTARRHGKSWAEIATKLGVTRQSAWERWRDLDETPPAGVPTRTGVLDRAASAVAEAAGQRRRRSTVTVPNVVGMSWDDARSVLASAGVVGVSPDPDGEPLAAQGWPGGMVTDQSPDSGARVPPGSPVTLWLGRRDGGSGVREPRRPHPTPREGRAMNPEPAE